MAAPAPAQTPPDKKFSTGQAAWRELLEDADVELFGIGDPNRNVVGTGARIFVNAAGNKTAEFGTIIVRRRQNRAPADAYVALQLHPPHTDLAGPMSELWHFHARSVQVVANARRRDVFKIFTPNVMWVETQPNARFAPCSNHYFIDPSVDDNEETRKSNAKFAVQVRKYFVSIGSKIDEIYDAGEFQLITERMEDLADQFKAAFMQP